MVYCRYCGEKNKDRSLNCRKCGEPLSLLPNEHPENWNSNVPNYANKRDLNKEFRNEYQDNQDNFNQRPIKSRYESFDPYNNNFDKNDYNDYPTDKLNSLSNSEISYSGENHRKNLNKRVKNYVEWDVVVATALLAIILASILQRFFPTFALSIALSVGLIYILIATKSKLGLFKAIPLAIVMVFTISAYFSL